MQLSDPSQLLAWITEILDQLAARRDRFSHVLIENRMQDLFFAFEIKIDRAVSDLCRARDVCNLGIEIPIASKHACRRPQDHRPLVADGIAG